jgi:arylsulfatase A-like enzyme
MVESAGMKILLPVALLSLGLSRQDPARPSILFALADDWSWPHAGVYGDKVVKVPNFDRLASEGMLFTHVYCASPSCTPSRAAMLTGQAIHRLEESGNLWSTLSTRFETYPEILEKQGYVVGLQGKGWGPGDFKPGGRTRNPAGPAFKSFADFLKTVPKDRPFCWWFGSNDPHRPYERGSGVASGMKPEEVTVPPYFPDTPETRGDICDYYWKVQRFDRDLGEHLALLEKSGRAGSTMVVVSGDNGWPFPRCKANLYDGGTRQPLAVRWPSRVKAGERSDAFIGLVDLAPTFLEAAGLPVPPSMTARSFLGILLGEAPSGRDRIFLERERHANARKGDLSYPSRALRTREWLYIRNLRPGLWPGGDPEKWMAVGPFGDCDAGPTKEVILARREGDLSKYFKLAFEKRPERELYDLKKDPHQLENVADRHPDVVEKMDEELTGWCRSTGDPRAAGGKLSGEDDRWDRFPYYGHP